MILFQVPVEKLEPIVRLCPALVSLSAQPTWGLPCSPFLRLFAATLTHTEIIANDTTQFEELILCTALKSLYVDGMADPRRLSQLCPQLTRLCAKLQSSRQLRKLGAFSRLTTLELYGVESTLTLPLKVGIRKPSLTRLGVAHVAHLPDLLSFFPRGGGIRRTDGPRRSGAEMNRLS